MRGDVAYCTIDGNTQNVGTDYMSPARPSTDHVPLRVSSPRLQW